MKIQMIFLLCALLFFEACVPWKSQPPASQVTLSTKQEPNTAESLIEELDSSPESFPIHDYVSDLPQNWEAGPQLDETSEEAYSTQESLSIHGYVFDLPQNWEVGPQLDANSYAMRTIEEEPKYFRVALQFIDQPFYESSETFRNHANTLHINDEGCAVNSPLIFCFTIKAFKDGREALYFFSIQKLTTGPSFETPDYTTQKTADREAIKEIIMTIRFEGPEEVPNLDYTISYIPAGWQVKHGIFYLSPETYPNWMDDLYSVQIIINKNFESIDDYMQRSTYANSRKNLETCVADKEELTLNGHRALEFTSLCLSKPHIFLMEIDKHLVVGYSYSGPEEWGEIRKMLESLEIRNS